MYCYVTSNIDNIPKNINIINVEKVREKIYFWTDRQLSQKEMSNYNIIIGTKQALEKDALIELFTNIKNKIQASSQKVKSK